MRHLPNNVIPVLAALRTGQRVHPRGHEGDDAAPGLLPFVTISRQAGAGGRSLANELAARLNAIDPGPPAWTVWDNELVERVATEHHLPAGRITALEDERPSWLGDLLSGLSIGAGAVDELAVYHRVAVTIRDLAALGRVIIVGRGASFVTAGMPGGVHVRLVAPVEYRVASTARAMGVSPEMAADWVRDKDGAREAFYRRHWPRRPLTPENFTATFNTQAVSGAQLVESILPLIPCVTPRAMAQEGARTFT